MDDSAAPAMTTERVAVFTCVIGGYETLNPQPAARGSLIPFICFTDDPALTSDVWQIRLIEPCFPADPVRSQRQIKFLPYDLLPDCAVSIYIDNSVELTQPPEALLAAVDLSSGLALPRHDFRANLDDEFSAVLEQRLDDPARVRALRQFYHDHAPDLLTRPLYWSGILIRDHRNPRLRQAMSIWRDQVWRYSRRDQLSLPYALSRAGVEPCVINIDNHQSSFHRWPVLNNRKTAQRIWRDDDPALAAIERLEQSLLAASRQLQTARALIAERDQTIATIWQSSSWRLTAPLRKLMNWLRR